MGITNLNYVRVPFLQKMLREEVGQGWTEFSCHPGYFGWTGPVAEGGPAAPSRGDARL
jgi:hypothetical protein